ncbi:hypothetical protein VMCG_08672 [Cytospora schulzeri]|uniref:Uncharacterized protein n=1 Tax=Cytospora schulzeri TaxID=448051 RepID=A0A423VTP2_9PEZI|nr:hypothetical protein VMCG_08672 [Valsa malicola]
MMPIPMPNTANTNTNTNTNTNNSISDATIYNNYNQQQQQQQQQQTRRKRKADSQDTNNERLSKRLSLLNLEQNGAKLYVPVEQTQLQSSIRQPSTSTTTANNAPPIIAASAAAAAATTGDEVMHLDDTSNKVYIYNLDDELSSESEPDDPEGKLVFLPDVEKHLRANRIIPGVNSSGSSSGTDAVVGGSVVVPRPILPNRDGELAGMQLVLYNEGPSSLTVPEEHDSVRKAIIEARARVRQRQQEEREAREVAMNPLLRERTATFATPVRVVSPSAVPMAAVPEEEEETMGEASYMAPVSLVNDNDNNNDNAGDDDADAMDID